MNQYLKIQEKIKHSEITYISCFSECFENEQIIRFRDSKMTDMHYALKLEIRHMKISVFSLHICQKVVLCLVW